VPSGETLQREVKRCLSRQRIATRLPQPNSCTAPGNVRGSSSRRWNQTTGDLPAALHRNARQLGSGCHGSARVKSPSRSVRQCGHRPVDRNRADHSGMGTHALGRSPRSTQPPGRRESRPCPAVGGVAGGVAATRREASGDVMLMWNTAFGSVMHAFWSRSRRNARSLRPAARSSRPTPPRPANSSA
jgi:hypothetical protein